MPKNKRNVVAKDTLKLSLTQKLVSTKKDEIKVNKKKIDKYLPNFNNVSTYTSDMLRNNDDILLLFPDIELSMEIVTSSIISPMDILNTKLTYDAKINYLTSSLKHNFINMTEDYVKETYNYEGKINKIVKESLFTHGSYINLIIPDNIFNKMVNDNTRVSGNEEVSFDNSLVSDNILEINVNPEASIITSGNEEVSENNLNLDKIFKTLKNVNSEELFNFTTNTETIVSYPTLLKIPVISFVPLSMKNDETKILGGFILVDDNGLPITDVIKKKDNYEIVSDLTIEDSILEKVKNELISKSNKAPNIDVAKEHFDKILTDKIEDILTNKHIESYINYDDLNIIKELMFSRLLINQKTKIIFVPEKYLEIYTINYRSNGTGESLLERIRILSSIRAINLFTKLAANTKNSIPTTKITLDIDDDDIEPDRTRDRIIAEFIKGKQLEVPIGLQSINDLSSWIHKFGYFFEVNNVNIPKITMSMDNTTSSINIPEDTLEPELRKRTILTLGTTPEMVDSAFDNDFATTTLISNALSAKRYKSIQDTYNELLTKNISKILRVDGEYKNKFFNLLEEDLKTIIKNIKKINNNIDEATLREKIFNDFINSIFISLPEIKTSDDMKISDEFDNYISKLDDVIESYLSSDFIDSETASELGDNIDTYKNIIRASVIRNWCNKNNFYPELSEMLTINDEGTYKFELMNEHVTHIEKLIGALKDPLKRDKKVKKKITKVYEKLEVDNDDEETDIEVNESSSNEDETQQDKINDEVDDNDSLLDKEL